MTSLDFLLWLESLRNPLLDALFAAITFLGSQDFALVVIPLIYWCINRTLGVRLAVVLLFSAYANEALKNIVLEPRPGAPLHPIQTDTAPGSAWPSGHAMNAAALWGTLTAIVGGARYYIGAVVIIFLIGFSRLYLGVHWPLDVISGWIIGGVIAVAATLLFRRFANLKAQDIAVSVLVGLTLLPVVLLLLSPTANSAIATGVGSGLILGWWLERHYVGFEAPAPLVQQLLKLLIGIAGVLALRYGLKPLFEPLLGEVAGDYVRYAIIGLWVGWLAPAIFVRFFGQAKMIAPATVRQVR